VHGGEIAINVYLNAVYDDSMAKKRDSGIHANGYVGNMDGWANGQASAKL
jgi:hypothetical protein